MMKPYRQTSFIQYTNDGPKNVKESIIVESSVDLWLEDMHLISFVDSPGYERELCIGYLITSGMISSMSEIEFSEVSRNRIVITANRKSSFIQSFLLSRSKSYMDIPPLSKEVSFEKVVDVATLGKCIDLLRENQVLHSYTGAAHGALLVHADSLEFKMIEDMGRHNAVDKVVGDFISNNYNLSECMLFVTGRLTSELVLKAAYARIPFMGSLTFATDLGIQIAVNVGITLLGSLKRNEFWLYNQGSIMPFQF